VLAVPRANTGVTLPSYRMADEFELIDLPVSGYESSPELEIEYFPTIHHESLDTFPSYMESLWEHVNLLYGAALVDRLNHLRLDQRELRLAGLLLGLVQDGKSQC
jgi:hypothetical protein